MWFFSEDPKMIIHTPVIEDFINVVKWALDDGKCWYNNDDTINERFWKTHKANTCIIIRNSRISFCRLFTASHFYHSSIIDVHTFYSEVTHNKCMKETYDLR